MKTETYESMESYQAMLRQMQDRMEKMEEKYETEMAMNDDESIHVGEDHPETADQTMTNTTAFV